MTDASGYKQLWTAIDNDGDECVIETGGDDSWQFIVTEGTFSGYPVVNLTREDLIKLRDALIEELSDGQ